MTSMVVYPEEFENIRGHLAVLSDPEDTSGKPYWIGEYDPYLTHQNGEPLFVWIAGNFSTLKEAIAYGSPDR